MADKMQLWSIGENDKTFMKTTLEEHYVMVGEPEGFYLDHFSHQMAKAMPCSSHTQCYQGYTA